jgi:NAD(P)-dependent dehydrogenase (short-subunit alcohol dehydrogenase family)
MAGYMKRVCVLTGAGGLLGTAFCRLYSADYDIVAVYRTRPPEVPSQLQRAVDPLAPGARLADNEHAVFALQADLAEPGQVRRVVELALARHERIDLLVNAAADTRFHGPIADTERLLPALRGQLELNLLVPMRLTAEVYAQHWRRDPEENRALRRGVVNVSSVSGLRIFGGYQQSMYSASKAALNYMTCHMAEELAAIGVRANAVAPNSFPSVVPTERVAEVIRELDNGESTGQVVEVDGAGERLAR